MDMDDIYPAKARKLFCNTCKTETNHHLVYGPFLRDYKFPGGGIETYLYYLWQCAGCEDLSLEVLRSFDVDIDGDGERFFTRQAVYPTRNEFHLEEKFFEGVPGKLETIYKEIIAAYNAQLYLLCSIGLRSLMEAICRDKKAYGKDLDEKIKSLKILLPENLVNSLDAFRLTGNKAAHQFVPPKHAQLYLSSSIEVIEDLLNYFYYLPVKSDQVDGLRNFDIPNLDGFNEEEE
jgi:hypothetical protein